MEQTTEEILWGLKQNGFPVDSLYSKLQESLTLADLVKFAKYTPFISDNEQSLKFAFEFVERTKPIVEEKKSVETEAATESKDEPTELLKEQDNNKLS